MRSKKRFMEWRHDKVHDVTTLVGVASFRKDEDEAKRKNEIKNCLHDVLKDVVAHLPL